MTDLTLDAGILRTLPDAGATQVSRVSTLQRPPLTVVIAVHNGEKYLRETISSVLSQEYAAQAVLIADDGSTDGTAEVVRSFGERVVHLRLAKGGVSAARNYGIAAAETEWVALMDHDDLWEAQHLGNLATAIAADPGADICYTGLCRLTFDRASGTFLRGEPVSTPDAAAMPSALMNRCAFIPSATALRREKVLAVGGFSSHFLNAQDWELWLRMRHAGARFAHSPQPTLLYRVHPESSTSKVRRAMGFYREVATTQVLPFLPPIQRVLHGLRLFSRFEADAAMLMRESGAPGALPMMLRSIARYPLSSGHRYKVAAHMLAHGYQRASQ